MAGKQNKGDGAESKPVKPLTAIDLMNGLFKKNKEEHFNFEKTIDYKVSTGSLLLDAEMDGGLGPGLHRAVGSTEAGKTSFCLEVAKNFLKMPKTRALYFKAEGRLGPEIQERSGIKIVTHPDDWAEGTMLVVETNIYEATVEFMTSCIQNNPDENLFVFILDSVDGLITRGDVDKSYEDSNKVAGGAVIAGNFMKRVSIPLAKRGHMALFISQVRSDIKLDTYSKAPIRLISGTGGNALMHFANWILEFERRDFKDDLILKDESNKKYDAKTNPIVGHWCQVIIRKSTNEKTNGRVSYPIKHGRLGGRSVWIEKEIADLLCTFEDVKKSGSWLTFDADFYNELDLGVLGLEPKYQGIAKLSLALENNPAATKVLRDHYLDFINPKNGIQDEHGEAEEAEETPHLQD